MRKMLKLPTRDQGDLDPDKFPKHQVCNKHFQGIEEETFKNKIILFCILHHKQYIV